MHATSPTLAGADRLAYAALRAVFGIVLLTHGLPKLLRTSHGSMADPMAGSIALIDNVLHLPGAPVWAMGVALLEGVGGALLALGLGTRAIAALVTAQMIAICIALGPTWPWIDRGIEYPLLMAFLAAYIALHGGGPGSIDHALVRARTA
ncbi:DoxX family protein [Lysobacter silvisoli]|uniref:DoxX family protein n=1 Tax=Lysobacter silvisoli TaxID=2293254 RepID=A0A371K2E5_9GAMM|nr:DoxX family protein [Lysobacter silvisoli]RDZ28054.1 DoxX family protein [Lysobacter silvisoli]